MPPATPAVDLPPPWDDPERIAARLAPVHARMRAAVDGGAPEVAGLYGWLRYHLGWAGPDGRPELARRAKGIRPLACLVAAEAVGGPMEAGVAPAAAVELTHEFSLVHDDLEDGDRLRRGRPTLWALVGEAQAINAGDALFAIARSLLAEAPVPAAVALDMSRRYDLACLALAEGQYLDIGFEQAADVAPTAYLAMVRRKTGALLGLAAGLGALAGGAAAEVADVLTDYGEAVGVAFQMQDDILGLWGDPAVTGKPVGADLARGKKSLPVILALDDPELAGPIRALLGSAAPDADRAAALAARIAAAGHREAVTAEARRWAARAGERLASLDLAPGPCQALAALAAAAVARAR